MISKKPCFKLCIIVFLSALVTLCHQPVSADWNVETVVYSTYTNNSSITLDDADSPIVALGGHHVYFSEWNGQGWTMELVDGGACWSADPSLAVDRLGRPVIAYDCDGSVRIARRSGQKWLINRAGGATGHVANDSFQLDGYDNPVISLCDSSDHALKLLRWDGSDWHIEIADTECWGSQTSMELGQDGNPAILYKRSSDLLYAQWNGTQWDMERVGDIGG
ncbi:hypothetical protein ACFLU6_09795 [Acidobacteriota bacterium]